METNPDLLRLTFDRTNLLATGELALALILLTGAGLVLKSLWLMHNTSAAFSPERVLVTSLETQGVVDKNQYLSDLVRQVEAIPDVQAAAVWNPGHQQAPVRFVGLLELQPGAENVSEIVRVSLHHPAASGIQLVAGRWIDDEARDLAARAAVVNAAMLKRYGAALPTAQAALGRQFRLGPQQFVVVGVVSDFRPRPDVDAKPMVYLPLGQFPFLGEVQLLVRSSDSPVTVSAALRRIVNRTPEVEMVGAQTLADQISGAIAPRRFQAGLLAAFGALALILAVIGVYGVLHYAVTERTQELGIRIALGATEFDVLRIVLFRSLKIAVAGTAAGIAGSLNLMHLMGNLLYGVRPTDLSTYALVCLVLAVAAIGAACFPARRATRIDPIEALRYE